MTEPLFLIAGAIKTVWRSLWQIFYPEIKRFF